MEQATVAIVGRPNVGKSTLFNRIIGRQDAIVDERPGVTRDRNFAKAEWAGRSFWLVDTGGIVLGSRDVMDLAIQGQVDQAVAAADLVLLVVDTQAGLHPVDMEIAAELRRYRKPILVVSNKCDDLPVTTDHLAMYELGLGEPVPVSATTGRGSGDLLDTILDHLPGTVEESTADQVVHVAVVGRPNAGKSSLINRLVGEDRVVVDAKPGTTRDSIDTSLRYHGRTVTFVDTAGLRKRARVDDSIEFYSRLRAARAIERADVCVLTVDAQRGMETQDFKIAEQAWEQGAALIIAVTKWDLVPEKDANVTTRGERILQDKVPFLKHVPFVYTSAVTGQRVHRMMDLVLEVESERQKRIPTAELNRVLQGLVARNQPPQAVGREVKLLYAAQIGVAPPAFAIISNRPKAVPESYARYIVNGFRREWAFKGAPVRLRFRSRRKVSS